MNQSTSPKLITPWKRINRFIQTTVLGGLVVVLPATLFLLVVKYSFDLVSILLDPIKQLIDFPGIHNFLIDLIALGLVLTAFFLIGLVIQTRLGNQLILYLENRLLGPLPFYTLIRDTVQQLFSKNRTPFSKVVLIQLFNSETLMTGFVAAESDTYLTVFVPTGPNPTNGFIFHVKPDQVQYVDVKPEAAMRTVIGVGTGSEILFANPAKINPDG